MEKGNIDDIWTIQKVGTPFPSNVAKAPGETNKYVALWYKHGKPVMGRAWNDSGVVKCTFVADNKIYSGPDVGGSIQLLIIEPGDNKPRSFHYDWVNYKKAQSLTIEGKYEMVRCEYSASVYWPEHGLLGCISTDKLVAYFVDNDSQIMSTKKTDELLVLCKIAGTKEAHVVEKEKEKSLVGSAIMRLSTVNNDWEDFNWGSAWPVSKNVMSTPKNIPSVGFDQFVALWYRHGKPVMGRAWQKNGRIEASFVDSNREFTGATVGSLQLLISLPPTTVGYDYVWMTYGQAVDYRDKDYVPVHLSYICPAIVPVNGKHLLGQVNMKTECATVALDGMVTQLDDNFAKVSSQQSQPFYSEASKIPAGSGPARDSTEDMASSKEGEKDASRKVKVPKRPEVNNGGSLEDCISNVFSLLELPGIKWKCFRPKLNAPRGVPLTSDLVLKAYSRCLTDGILCTWRRKPSPPTGNNELLPPTHFFSNDSPKELWVFWYDAEPTALGKYCEGLDSDEELSSANQMNIVSYEVRTILFKALHVVLERDLTKDGFVRFGRWFTMPLVARDHYLHFMYPSHSPAIRFNFFVHGTSTICASIQAQRQPTLIKLARRHFECKTPKRFPVVIGPWSMRGYLIADQMTLLADPKIQEAAEKEWNQWKEYLQLEEKEPENVTEERQKTPEAEPPAPPQTTRVLLASSSDEDQEKNEGELKSEEVSQKIRWMFEPDLRQDKPKEETAAEKEKRMAAREVRRLRRQRREERRREMEKQRRADDNLEDYDSDVVTDQDEDEAGKEEIVNNDVPKMILIEIDNVRLLYPSKFVCITVEEDRQMLESMGFKCHPIPQELQVPGRRPRNKNVVNMSNPLLSTMAVYQYVQNEKRAEREHFYPRNKPVEIETDTNFEILSNPKARRVAPPKSPTFLSWESQRANHFDTTDIFVNRLFENADTFDENPRLIKFACLSSQFIRRKWKWLHKKQILFCGKARKRFGIGSPQNFALNMMKSREKRKEYQPYHRKRPAKSVKEKKKKAKRKVKKFVRYNSPEQFLASMSRTRKKFNAWKQKKKGPPPKKDLAKKEAAADKDKDKDKEKDKEKDKDNDDDPFVMDKVSQLDWANFSEDETNGNSFADIEDLYNPAGGDIEEGDETSNESPDEKTPEGSPNGSPRPKEEIEPFFPITYLAAKPSNIESDLGPDVDDMTEEQFNTEYVPKEYDITQDPKKVKNGQIPISEFSKDNQFYHGEICRLGLRGYKKICAERDREEAARRTKWLQLYRLKVEKRSIKTARQCHRDYLRQIAKRCLRKALRRLRITAKKDALAPPPPKPKPVDPVLKKKEDAKKFEMSLKIMERDLGNLDMSAFCQVREKAGPHGVRSTAGYMKPNYFNSPHGFFDHDSEPEFDEQRTGLGEGTSDQYQDGESVDMIDIERELANDPSSYLSNAEHIRTLGEHIGPDGMLSPPASNEMPKGGPLSADASQAHSPSIGGKFRSTANDDIDRAAASGKTIVDIEIEDIETGNMQRWNKIANQSKLSKFLVASRDNPILKGRKTKYDTPATDKFEIRCQVERVTVPMAYESMVTRNFECAPPHTFAELIRQSRTGIKKYTRPLQIQSTLARPPPGATSPLPPPTPMFNPHTLPLHHTSPFSAGPMSHHSMGPPAYPPTPGPYPPTTPTYPGMTPRPGSSYGPGYPNHHQMMPPGYPNQMGQMGGMNGMGGMPGMGPIGMQRQFSNPQMYQHHQMMRMQQMRMQGGPPGYGAPGVPQYPQQSPVSGGPGGFGVPSGPSSVQRLNNFVNQSQFGPSSGPQNPYGTQMPPMIPQSPSFNQPYPGMGNQMMSPMQQHQFQQQQMMQQQQQQQQHQLQLQRSQAHQIQHQPNQQTMQSLQLTPEQLQIQQSQQVQAVFQQLPDREKRKYQRRQIQLMNGLMPTSLQPASIKALKNPPDANIPYKRQDIIYNPPNPAHPRGDSLTIAIVLSDTLLDLHFDSVFDACPICSCSVSIRSRDLGMYIIPHAVLSSREIGETNKREYTTGTWSGFHVNSATSCTCGFSAIRHRYLSCCAGLFDEDADEATASEHANAPVIPPLFARNTTKTRDMMWFDPQSVHDLALTDQIRQMAFSNSLGKAVSQMATEKEHRRNITNAVDIGTDITVPTEYVLSHVDTLELMMLGMSALGPMQTPETTGNQFTPQSKYLSYFHPWGFQTANEIAELESSEWVDLLDIITPTLESSMKQARRPSVETPFVIEGPMTWKQVVTKAIRGKPPTDEDEDFSLAEPVPAVMRALEQEAVRAAPNIEQYYDQAELGPVDQPKDVMYITIIPDNDDIYERTVKFMHTMTETYERMRLGRHIPFPVSTGTASRFREVLKTYQHQFPYQEQNQQLVEFTNNRLEAVPQELSNNPDPLNTDPEKWSKRLKRKLELSEELKKADEHPAPPSTQSENSEGNAATPAAETLSSIFSDDAFVEERHINSTEEAPTTTERPPNSLPYRITNWHEKDDDTYEHPPEVHDTLPEGFYEREGILRVGKPLEPLRISHTVVSTREFDNMTQHLSDAQGFVSKLRIFLQQMEDLVFHTLSGSSEAFERRGYRYQMAVEGRLKRQKHKRDIEEERLRYEAAKVQDEADKREKMDEADLFPGAEVGEETPSPWVDDELEEKKRNKQKENEQYPAEESQAPSPVPAGMIHIPETLSEQERKVQPTLADMFADPSTVAPINAQNIPWKQRDTRVQNPFPYSNQPPVAFEAVGSNDTDAYSTLPHVIVLYVVNPFSYGAEGQSALHMRIALLSFIRAYNSIVGRLPFTKRTQLQLEIIGMESLDDMVKGIPDYLNDSQVPFDILHDYPVRNERPSESGQEAAARSLSVAVYTHPRVFTPEVYKAVSARCMTAFGPGSQLINTVNNIEKMNQEAFYQMSKRSKTALNNMDGYMGMMGSHQVETKAHISYRVPSNIVCLAPPPAIYQMDEEGKPILNQLDEQTLFISYCLVGTEYLVATATDSQGKLIDNCIANMKPRRLHNQVYRYKNKTQILDGMGKLWSFILGVMSSDIKNWRLVVGRLGRIGHGEFRAWTHLLNKTSLLRYSSSLKDICGACRSMPSAIGTPAILSACLITLEPEPSIRIMPKFHDIDESIKKNLIFQTPGDLSCTHILTFPVGTEINLEVQDQTADTKGDENWEFGDLDIMEGLDDGDTEIMKDLGLETPSSAAIRQTGGVSMFFSEDSSSIEIQNQPLASGYYISTAPAPELPSWFWATCPSAKRHSPVHLKSSLHINISEVKNDDIAMESAKDKEKEKEEKDIHPLESRQTEEVLRHVLESYNALSWLNLNRQTGDRYSCLPIHVQHLLRLYHSVARLLV
ncbi:hypothetical protein L5515_014078 [Caenorhabditis briggsae]|uniref:Mediator of RNA polymerase II transcription subunit 13 n=1 Tax=Caenorhabditis briggsae TaxID=6238 RepID=A0AAE9J7I3_CAEBR|nr:hypothetical protein L5515_014078 [Caenorhabditis briggsae]